MNSLIDDKNWVRIGNRKVKVYISNGNLVIENNSDKKGVILYKKPFRKTHDEVKCEFYGSVVNGESPVLKIVGETMTTMQSIMFNSTAFINFNIPRLYFFAIQIAADSKAIIHNVSFSRSDSYIDDKLDSFQNDILVLSPSYPSDENKYLSGFVHSRIREYKNNGVNVDVAVVYESYTNSCRYTFEDVLVSRITYAELRILLGKKKYSKILIHFFDNHFFDVLEGCDVSNAEIYIWVHGPETLYWDYPYFTTNYFSELNEITEKQKQEFKANDLIINKINDMPNVTFVFVSNWIKQRSEELINIKFKNYEVIPNVIDVDLFDYQEKNHDQMRRVFMLRRYDDISKYAVDISVKTILELSKRKCFDELVFNIYGKGDAFDRLFKPIKHLDNVHFFKSFYSHKEIAELHKENGIALFPTRYDAQGVSMCEAGSSGLLIVSSDNDAIKEFIPYRDGNIIETEDYKQYADFIESIIYDRELFKKITLDTRNKIVDLCSYESTVGREIKLIKSNIEKKSYSKDYAPEGNPVLSIIIPSYNVANYITHTLQSIIEGNNNASKLEIIVVNDGSKDSTVEVVKSYIDKVVGDSSIVRIIDKENGGHGSTINVGIKEAHGKYLRIIDGDDWVNTYDLEKLIDILENETSDIVLTDYCEDIYVNNTVSLKKRRLYDFMTIGEQYSFDAVYAEYGFGEWGPVMATANIKLERLREAGFKLSEKSFYVDMEFNAFYLPSIDTISYYDLDIYRYYIGRIQQSTNIKTFSKSDDQHRKVILNILDFTNKENMSQEKKDYVYEKIISPMLSTQYGYLLRSSQLKKLNSFSREVKKMMPDGAYSEFLKDRAVMRAKGTAKNAANKAIFNKYTYKIATSRAFSTGVGRKLRNYAFDYISKKR